MKRILSLVLVLALVLGTIPAGFAATATAGETLKGYGLLAGDTSGNLNEDKTINRAEMMVVFAQLLGKKTEAAAYSIPSTSKDVKAGTWYAPYVAFAEKEAWTAGKGNGMFDPMGKVTVQEAATFMMKALGYTVTDYSTVVADATAKGLLKDVTGTATAPIVRGSLFVAALNTLNTPVKDATTTLGAKLGVIKPAVSAVDPKTATAISHKVVQVVLVAEVKAVNAADFSIVDKAGKALEVKAASLISPTKVWLDTADQAVGTMYTVKAAGKSLTFTGIQKDASLPEVDKSLSKAVDNTTIKIVFTKALDPRTALVAANYTFTNGLTATAVEFDKNADGVDVRTTVFVTTAAQEANKLFKVTAAPAVTDLYGNKVQTEDDKNFFNFVGIKADTTAPKIKSTVAENGKKVVVEFDDKSDMDKVTALNPANYVFVNKTDATKVLTATSVKFKTGVEGAKLIVFVTTSDQVEKSSYELTLSNVTDKFGNVLVNNKASFTGAPLDKTAPKIAGLQASSNTVIKITFSEVVTEATAVVAANYTADKDLAITKAELDSTDEKIVWLTTSAQKSSNTYKLTINNVADEYGNAISAGSQIFAGGAEDTSKPYIASAYAYVDASVTKVRVTFSAGMKESTAKVASNYFFGSAIGYGISVTKITDTTYDVKVNSLSDGTLYTLAVNNVENLAGTTIDYEKNEKQFLGKVSADTAAAKLVTAVTVDKGTVKLIFDKTMLKADLENVANYTFTKTGVAYLNTAPAKTLAAAQVFGGTPVAASDNKSVSIRFTSDVFKDFDNTSTTFNVALANMKGLNNAVIDPANDDKDFYSTSVTTKAPAISSVTPIDDYTVDVKFNQSISKVAAVAADATTTPPTAAVVGFNLTGVTFAKTAAEATTLATAERATVLSTDDTILRIKSTVKIESGVKYTVKFANSAASKLQDEFGQLTLVDDAKDTFYGSSNTIVAPGYLSHTAGPVAGSLTVTFSKELSNTVGEFDISLITIKGKEATNAITLAKFDGNDKSKVDIYFNNEGLEVGRTYELVIGKGAFMDTSAKVNDEVKISFGVTSSTRDAVKIDGVTIGQTKEAGTDRFTTMTVVFNKPVKGLTASSFVVTTSQAGAYVAATIAAPKDADGAALLATGYYKIVTFKITNPTFVATESAVRVQLGTDVLTARDGAIKATGTQTVYDVEVK